MAIVIRELTPSLTGNRLRLLSRIRSTLNRVADFSQIEADATRPRFIVTEPGVGYRLRTEVPAAPAL